MIAAIKAAKARRRRAGLRQAQPARPRDAPGRRAGRGRPAPTRSSRSTRSGRAWPSTSRPAQPRMGGADGYGWLSGPALKPLAVRCVHDVASVGRHPGDRLRRRVARHRRDRDAHGRRVRRPGLHGRDPPRARPSSGRSPPRWRPWLERHGHAGPAAVTGLALGRMATRSAGAPVLDLDLCNGCGLCELSCAHDAIRVVDGKAVIDEELCARCGLCLSRCRPGALLWSTPAAG